MNLEKIWQTLSAIIYAFNSPAILYALSAASPFVNTEVFHLEIFSKLAGATPLFIKTLYTAAVNWRSSSQAITGFTDSNLEQDSNLLQGFYAFTLPASPTHLKLAVPNVLLGLTSSVHIHAQSELPPIAECPGWQRAFMKISMTLGSSSSRVPGLSICVCLLLTCISFVILLVVCATTTSDRDAELLPSSSRFSPSRDVYSPSFWMSLGEKSKVAASTIRAKAPLRGILKLGSSPHDTGSTYTRARTVTAPAYTSTPTFIPTPISNPTSVPTSFRKRASSYVSQPPIRLPSSPTLERREWSRIRRRVFSRWHTMCHYIPPPPSTFEDRVHTDSNSNSDSEAIASALVSRVDGQSEEVD